MQVVSRQLLTWVVMLSFVAVLGIIAATAMGLWGTVQGTRRRLGSAAAVGARIVDDTVGDLKAELTGTSGTLAVARDTSEALRHLLERNPAITGAALVLPNGQTITQHPQAGQGVVTVDDRPWLAIVEQGDPYVGPVSYEHNSVPVTTIAVPVHDRRGDVWATLVAEVDLTSLSHGLAEIRVGDMGYVYVTDGDGHPVLYPHPQSPRDGTPGFAVAGISPTGIVMADRLSPYSLGPGQLVFGDGVPVRAVPWYAIAEQPAVEIAVPFAVQFIVPLVLLLAVGGLTYGIVRFVRARITHPLSVLHEGAVALSQEDLAHRIEIDSRDEFGELASTVNMVAVRLEGIVGLMEQRVAERTETVRATLDVSRATASVLDPDELVHQVVDLVRDRFDLYYVGLFLLDETSRFAVLHAGTGAFGKIMQSQGHRLEVGGDSMIGRCIALDEPGVALDVGDAPVRFANPLLPDTRSELALPMHARGRVIGALTVQSAEEAAFGQAYVEVLQVVCDQVAVAIDNAQLFADAQSSLEELRSAQERYLGEVWTRYTRARAVRGYAQTPGGMLSLEQQVLPEVRQAVAARRPVIGRGRSAQGIRSQVRSFGQDAMSPEKGTSAGRRAPSALVAPILYGDQPIGALGLRDLEGAREWSEADVELVQAISEQFAEAAENLRLLEQTQRSESIERATREVTDEIRAAVSVEDAIERTLGALARVLGAQELAARIGVERAPAPGSLDGGGEHG